MGKRSIKELEEQNEEFRHELDEMNEELNQQIELNVDTLEYVRNLEKENEILDSEFNILFEENKNLKKALAAVFNKDEEWIANFFNTLLSEEE